MTIARFALYPLIVGALVTAVADAGLQVRHLSEQAEPFWRMDGVAAAAWQGRLPNSFALLACRR